MDERLWAATLTVAQLAPWLHPPRDDVPYTILERLAAIEFPAQDEAIDAGSWEQGRIFGEQFELRWERVEDEFRVWLAGSLASPSVDENRRLDGAEALPNLENTNVETVACFLWGQDEVRVARPPSYRALPQAPGRPQLSYRNFRSANGTLVYTRYTGMAWEGMP